MSAEESERLRGQQVRSNDLLGVNCEIRFVGDLQRLGLLPGDVVVITTDKFLSNEERRLVHQYCKHVIKDNAVLVLDGGMKVGAIGAATLDA